MKRGMSCIGATIALALWAVAPTNHPGPGEGQNEAASADSAGPDNSLVWVASDGFSSMQGVNGWSYRFEESPGKLKHLTWNPDRYWEARDVATEIRITPTEQIPAAGHPIVRSWLAPYTGTIRVEGRAAVTADNCPDGPTVSIHKGKSVLWKHTLKARAPASHDKTIEVFRGEVVGFRVVRGSEPGCAAAAWDPRVTYLDGPSCWRLVWHDEFNDRSLTAPDPAKWRVWDEDKAPCPGCPDLTVSDGEQMDWLIDTWQRADNIVVADGVATIHTRHDGPGNQPFSGGMMDTRGLFEPNGGIAPAVRLEAKTLRSTGDTVRPAFWTLGGTDAINAYKWDPTELDTPAAQGRHETVGSREFSPIQGGGNWYYEFVDDDGTYQPLDYSNRTSRWEKPSRGRFLRVARDYQVPDQGHAVARAWQAPHPGRVRIVFDELELVRKDCGDGVMVSIRVGPVGVADPDDERVEWSRTLRRGRRLGQITRMVSVRKGERIRFRVDPLRGGCDRTEWDPTIEYNQWPARGEIDIMEYTIGRRAVLGAHTPALNQVLKNAALHVIRRGSIDPYAWVVSWVDWHPDRLEFFFAESKPGEAPPAQPYLVYGRRDGPDQWPFDQGHYLILHDKIKPKSAEGTHRPLPDFPTVFRVDYVRVWEYTCDNSTTPGD